MTKEDYRSGSIDAQERRRRIALLIKLGRITTSSDIPERAIPIDAYKIYGGWDPPLYFEDRPFTCRECGRPQVWRAKDQKWYYEDTQHPYFMNPVQCRECRKKSEGKPNNGPSVQMTRDVQQTEKNHRGGSSAPQP